MLKKTGWFPLVIGALGILVISCGGGGGNGSKSFSETTRSIQGLQRSSALSMAKSGIAMAPFFRGGSGDGGGTTGSSTGGSGGGGGADGITGIGFFFRGFGGGSGLGPAIMRRSKLPDDGGSTTGSGGGGVGEDDFYFDDWLQLWADVQWTNNTFSIYFYQDSNKTMPAGHSISTFTGDPETFPQTYSYDYEFTAGTWNGAHGRYVCSSTSWTEGSMQYENTYADGSHDTGESEWSEASSSWHSRWDGPIGQGWYQDSGQWNSNGAGTYSCSNSEGWTSEFIYNADWSGSAHLSGPDPKLPAEMTWDSKGHYKVTYADGSQEEWDWSDFWDDGESGTSGTTGTTGTIAFNPR